MTDAGVTTIVTGVVTISGMVVGFLTLWVKLQYASNKAEDAADRARVAAAKAEVVERKLDSNSRITESVNAKADTIVEQTNGSMEQTRALVIKIAERVSKLEDYNRESSHRVFDAVNTLSMKVERLMVMQEVKSPTPPPHPASEGTSQ